MLTKLRHSRAVGLARYYLYRDVLLARPRRRRCNVCGWRGRRFLTYYHRHVLCPQCGAHVRHRLLAAVLGLPAVASRVRLDGLVLHLSPEYCLGLVLRPRARRYVRADFATADCDVRLDATRLPFASASVDLLVASDLLEHVPDDRLALAEFHRVLRPGGAAILTVPQGDGVTATFEDSTIDTPGARLRAYGQPDHLRIYGTDFEARLADAGFSVTWFDASAFGHAFVARQVLRPTVPRAERWDCNDRRIYIAERP